MCVEQCPVVSQENMPKTYLQRPQMDESAVAGRETQEEQGRTLTGRASRPVLVTRASRVQVRLPMVLLMDGPASALVPVWVQALVVMGAVGGGMSRVSMEPQTSARRRCCDCDQRQNQSRAQGRRVSGQSLDSRCSRREQTPVSLR